MKVLIVDDKPVNITVLSSFVRKLGFETLCAESGPEALRIFESNRPDIVLLDLMMPGMNGAEVAEKMRVMAGRHWVPIVMVSASSQETDRSMSLEHGADAYLVKPITFQALASKLAAMQRIAALQHQLEIQLEELQRYHDYIEEEQRLAQYIMGHLAPPPKLDGLCTLVRPARGFSGDYLSAAERPNGKLYLILADATGHGLSAAVCLVPVFTVFEGMVKKDLPIAQIGREMNRELKTRTPTGHFVAITLVHIDREQGITEVWNGGNPSALLLYDTEHRAEIRSQHPPVGLLQDERFDTTTETVYWEKDCSVLLISDGVSEANDPDGQQFGMDRVREVFHRDPLSVCDELTRDVTAHLGTHPADDDMSILSMTVKRKRPPPLADKPSTAEAEHEPDCCVVHVRLGPEQIRSLNIAHVVNQWSQLMHWPRSLNSPLLVAATELIVNAIDHGLLRLDSKLKEGPDGMERYFKLRSERLAALHAGRIDITLRALPLHAGGAVTLSIEDSGPGFDFTPWLSVEDAGSRRFSGRGLMTVRSLAHELTFHKNGRLVQVHFLP